MTDREAIEWARRLAAGPWKEGSVTQQRYSRLADLAERGAEGWQPIATAPMNGTEVLLWRDADGIAIGYYDPQFCGNGQWWCGGGFLSGEPTHWRLLPEPPVKS